MSNYLGSLHLSADTLIWDCALPSLSFHAREVALPMKMNTSPLRTSLLILSYNNENSLACVLSIAYYYARNDYFIHRELASGKGFADLVLIPRKNVSSPAIILELKYDKDADSAIEQIKRKQYPSKVAGYAQNLLLVGINYDKGKKTHECQIEKWTDPS